MAEHRAAGTEVTVWSVGKKAPSYLRFRGIEVARVVHRRGRPPEFGDARDIAAVVAAPFVAGEIDLVQMVSTRFISAGTQRVERDADAAAAAARGRRGRLRASDGAARGLHRVRAGAREAAGELAPRALEAEIFAALLEGAAAFFTAQQRAMAAATENADELVRTLTRVMNRARQDAITTEIMEIVGGAEALRQSKGA